MSYLTDDEIATYCTKIEGVIPDDVKEASSLIDSYLGRTLTPKEFTDKVRISKNRRGKLSHAPILSIQSAKMAIIDPYFGRTIKPISKEDIELDFENDGYFTYVGSYGLDAMVWGNRTIPRYFEITYTSGFETYPERLKVACAMLAQNIRQIASYSGAKSVQSLDYQIAMTDDSFFTSDIKQLLKGLDKDVRAL